jgi:UTP-glucose-1-phosphate uridylyltransferase
MKPTLLVLAAGMGSRYGGLKQIDPVGPSGEIIIDYSIYDAIRAGFGKVVFIIRKEIEESFKETIGARFEGKLQVEYAYQELDKLPEGYSVPADRAKPWGTGHAILCAKDVINEPFAVINADDFYGKNGYKLLCDYLSNAKDGEKADYCMVGYLLRNTLSEHGSVARGVCATENGLLQNVVEMTKIEKVGDAAKNVEEGAEAELTGDEIVSLNFWGFTPSIFKRLEELFADFLKENINEPKKEFFIPSVVDELIKTGKAEVKALETPDSWFGITYRDDKPRVVESINKLVNENVYPEKLF